VAADGAAAAADGAAVAADGAAAACAPEPAGAGLPVALERSFRPLTQAILLFFSCSCLCASAQISY
jgi:hypothetical protein